MSHCLDKMTNALNTKYYDFWYYQSLLEEPYVTLQAYYEQAALDKEVEMLSLIEEQTNIEFKPQRGPKGISKYAI